METRIYETISTTFLKETEDLDRRRLFVIDSRPLFLEKVFLGKWYGLL